jgi:trk system potassium uptake protein TrkA
VKVAVVGAGSAGRDLVAKLSEMGQDVIVIDENGDALRELEQEFDVMTLQANGADPDVYEDARVGQLDLLAAVTPRDEINLLASCWAKAAGARHTVARLSESKYRRSPLVDVAALGVDMPLIHKEECTREVFNVLFRPGALEVTSLLGDRIAALGLKLPSQTPLAGKPLRMFRDDRWFGMMRFIGLVKRGRLSIPDGNAVFEPGDDVYVVLPSAQIDSFLDWVMAGRRKQYRRVVIAGGGELGMALARLLDASPMEVVLIESHGDRARHAAEQLKKSLVLNADATAASTLREAGLDAGTAFAAITGDEEMNIMCCIQAKQHGAGFTMARIDKSEYVPIIDHLNLVDRVITPNTTLIRTIVKYLRGRSVENVGVFHRIAGETQEVVVQEGSRKVGRRIGDLKLPAGSIVAAVQRDDDVFVPTGEYVLEVGDRLAVYCLPHTAARVKSAF